VCTGSVGAVFCIEASRLARNGRDWHHLIDLCALVGAVLIDPDGVYDPRLVNDRLLLGLKGTMSEYELSLVEPQSRRGPAQLAIIAITRIHQNRAARKARLAGGTDVIERNLRLGLEADVFRHAAFAPALVILDPVLRQIEPIRYRQAGMRVGQRKRHRDLAIVLLECTEAVMVFAINRAMDRLA
jgi:hypothetical protein